VFLRIFHNCPFLLCFPLKHTISELKWWDALFRHPKIEQPIPGPHVVSNLDAFSDASLETGIGIVIGSRWRVWQLIPGWKGDGRDIGWAEALGF
jgi:hypothetical protein